MLKPTRLHRFNNYPYSIFEDIKEEDGKEIVIIMNSERYVLTVYPSGMCEMEYPKRTSEFYIDNIFIENAELPLIRDGRLIQHLQEKVKKELGLSLPEIPYYPALKLTPKD